METTFEYILLKKLIVNGEYFSKVIPLIEAKYFQAIGNQELFKLIKNYYTTYKSIPTPTELIGSVKNVANEEIRKSIILDLQKINATDEVKNLQFMLDETVTFVKDALFMEALILGSDGIQKKDDVMKLKSKRLMEEMSKVSIDTDLGLSWEDIETMIKYYQEKLIGILTSHDSFNKRLGTGFLPKTLSVIMAASGIGKSLLMTDLLSGMLKDGKNILMVSMEMQDREIMKRVHANALDLEINKLKTMSPDAIRVAHNNLKVGQLFVKDYPNGHFSALMLEQLLDSYKIEKNVEFDIVFLDYIGIMKSDLLPPSVGLYSYVKSIAEEVRAVAVNRNIPIVSASQLNRSAVNDTDASNDSVSDSIGTVQTADFIVFLLQDEQMKEEKRIIAKCTKNRFTGMTDKWEMNIDYEHMRFSDAITISSNITDLEVDTMINNIRKNDVKIIEKANQENAIEEDDGFAEVAEKITKSAEEYNYMKELGL